MAYPADLKYTKDHEWVRVTGDTAEVGITEYAQQPSLFITGSTGQSGMIGNPGLADSYDATCPSTTKYVPTDASTTFGKFFA